MRFKGTVRPRHAGHTAEVWRRHPDGVHWRKIDEVIVGKGGRMTWPWHTLPVHEDPDDPWRVRFVIPDHGTSNIVRLYVSDDAE